MGWKSTVGITRDQAIELIVKAKFDKSEYDEYSNSELSNMVERAGYGDVMGMDFYGHNFIVHNTDEEIE